MAYTFRFLTAEQRTAVAERAATPAPSVAPGEGLQRAWEADLAGHQALLATATDDDTKTRHAEAVKALEQALTKAAARSR